MLVFPSSRVIHGDALLAELKAAGFVADDVHISDGELVVVGPADSDVDAVRAMIDAHVPPPAPPDAQAEFDKALAAAAAKTTTDAKLAALFDALRGVGLPGKAAARTAR